MLIISLLGAPGSGKGTIGRMLAENFGWEHFSVGDFLRASRIAGHFNDKPDVLLHLDQGRLLPSETLLPLIGVEIEAQRQSRQYAMLIDGFPRSLDQAIEFETLIQRFDLVIYLDCPKELARQRFLDRKLPGRIHQDDGPMFDKRFDDHEEKSPGIIQHCHSVHLPFVKVDSSENSEVTYHKLLDALKAEEQFGNLVQRA